MYPLSEICETQRLETWQKVPVGKSKDSRSTESWDLRADNDFMDFVLSHFADNGEVAEFS
ncbi:hypothetical protein N7488_004132 [Penicillium malachiteum]|nr:hypothetical protein N7488_004132 [Penicillium malachiteum]